MRLRCLLSFDEAFIITEQAARSHGHIDYLGQAYRNYRSSHGGAVRFGLLRYILCDLLKLDDGDYFVDLGSGCGIIPNCVGVYKPLVNSVGIEFYQPRFEISLSTSITLHESNNLIRSFSPPLFIHGDMTDEHTMVHHLSQPNLKMFFNNFNGLMLYDGIQQIVEEMVNEHCLIDTKIVSLGPMHFDDNVWTKRQFNHTVKLHELSWMAHSCVIKIYVYRRYA
jgi:hypothetical protein